MNLNSNKTILPFLTVFLGLIALLLHLGMQLMGTDEKGLLIGTHPLAILLLAVTALACLTVTPALRRDFTCGKTSPAAAAIGCFALAGGIAAAVISGFGSQLRLEQIRSIFGILAIPALITVGLQRFSGRKPFFLFHVLVCLYLMLHTVSHYQVWSSSPQWLHWLFPMAASVLLILFSYQQAALAVSMGDRRVRLITGLLAVFFCIGAIARENSLLYLGGALWALTNLCAAQSVAAS